MSARSLSFLFAVFILAGFTGAAADDEEAYFGEWSNDHGDVLRITAETIQLNDDKSMRYDDITEDSDGSFYLLQITTSDESNSFDGKYKSPLSLHSRLGLRKSDKRGPRSKAFREHCGR